MTREQRLPHPDTITERITELRILWPALPAALPRDTGTDAGERVHTSSDPHVIPINPYVAATIRRLAPHMNSLNLYEQQYADAWTNWRPADAWPITNHITRMLTDARQALGLNRPDTPIGANCPRHDQPLTPLITPGDHGELRYDQIAADGTLEGGWIRWTHTDVVTCHHCDEQWPPAQYLWLSRLVTDADNRRAAFEQDFGSTLHVWLNSHPSTPSPQQPSSPTSPAAAAPNPPSATGPTEDGSNASEPAADASSTTPPRSTNTSPVNLSERMT